jgi:hypothetical protein
MIALASDYLLFTMAGGESVPFSAEMISVELMDDTAKWFDAEFVRHAAHAVFHYFKSEMGRQSVSISEFAEALEKVLRGFKRSAPQAADPTSAAPQVPESDLSRLACESGQGCELFFFPSLRDELRRQLSQSPRVLRFHGLRSCVKQLVGARRWTPRCRSLEDRIVEFLRQCLGAEARQTEFALVVE